MLTVVVIRSLSYTGTTWINLLLGCHDRAFALGPPKRVLDLLDQGPEAGGQACRVHGEACTFWPDFFRGYDPQGNFYVQLAEASGRNVIVINNPVPDGTADRHLRHPNVVVRNVAIVRDGRAVISSYSRYHPEADFLDAVREWFHPFAEHFAFDPGDPDVLAVNYEDVVADQFAFLRRAGAFVGLEYPAHANRFWEFDHHATSGNAGPVGVVRRHQGHSFQAADAEQRESRYQELMADPDKPPLDRRWAREWGDRDRLVFDYFAGDINEGWGYERDRFTLSEIRSFEQDLGEAPRLRTVQVPTETQRMVRRLRHALRVSTLRTEGLYLLPRQVKVVGRISIAFYMLSLAFVAVLAAVIF